MVSAADLAVPGSVTVTDAQAAMALGIAEAYCGWSLEQKSLSVSLDSGGGAILVLPSLFVRSVESLSLRGVDRYGQPFRAVVEGIDWDWSENGVLRWLGFDGWPCGPRRVEVAFTSGYDVLPAAVLAVVGSVAERVVSVGSVQSRLENVGGIQTNTTYAQSVTAGIGLTTMEQAVLDRYRIAVAH